MELYLLRHGLAADLDEANLHKDSERPLTAEGRKKLDEVVEAMKALDLYFDLILTSPYVRAQQTAERVAKELKLEKNLRECAALEPGGDFADLAREVKTEKSKFVLLVGHEPYLSELISWLVSGKSGFRVTMKKAGLCKLTLEMLKPGAATLEWLLTPKQMRFMH
jgi:phosphohistidine phosphatase